MERRPLWRGLRDKVLSPFANNRAGQSLLGNGPAGRGQQRPSLTFDRTFGEPLSQTHRAKQPPDS